MAEFKILDEASGRTLAIEANSKEEAAAKFSEWQASQNPQGQPQEEVSTAYDAMRSFGSGLVKGNIGLASLPNLVEYGVDAAGEALGIGDLSTPQTRYTPGYDDIKKATESVIGKLYEPKTGTGKVFGTAGEFVGTAWIPGGGVVKAGKGAAKLATGTAAKKSAETLAKRATHIAPNTAGNVQLATKQASMLRNAAKARDAAIATQKAGKGMMAKGATQFGTNVALPFAGSEAAGQLTEGSDVEPYARVMGAIAGGAVPTIASRALTPVQLNAQRAKSLKKLRDAGVDPTPAGMSGSFTARGSEQALANVVGGRNMNTRVERQFTRAVLKELGIPENALPAQKEITRESVGAALRDHYGRLGKEFDAVESIARIERNTQNDQIVKEMLKNFQAYAGKQMTRKVLRDEFGSVGVVLENYLKGSPISGKDYVTLRKQVGRKIRFSDAGSGQKEFWKSVAEGLDDMVESTLGSSPGSKVLQRYKETRQKYKNLSAIDEAFDKMTNPAVSQGLLTPKAIIGPILKRDPGVKGTSWNSLKDLAEAGNEMLFDVPNSYTSQRFAFQGGLAYLGNQLMGGGVDPASAAMAAGGAVVAPGFLSQGYGLKFVQDWLKNQKNAAASQRLNEISRRWKTVPAGVAQAQAGASETEEAERERRRLRRYQGLPEVPSGD